MLLPIESQWLYYFIYIYIKMTWEKNLMNIESVVSWIYSVTFFLQQSNISINFDSGQQHNSQNTKFMLPRHSNHWNTEKYRGSADRGEVDLESDVNCLASGNIGKYTTVPSQCEWVPLTWTWRILYFGHCYHV